jgi:hypothetical protein
MWAPVFNPLLASYYLEGGNVKSWACGQAPSCCGSYLPSGLISLHSMEASWWTQHFPNMLKPSLSAVPLAGFCFFPFSTRGDSHIPVYIPICFVGCEKVFLFWRHFQDVSWVDWIHKTLHDLGIGTNGRVEDVRKGCRRVNMVEIIYTYVWKMEKRDLLKLFWEWEEGG